MQYETDLDAGNIWLTGGHKMNPLRLILDYLNLTWRRNLASTEAINRYQQRAVLNLLRQARQHSPFYQNLYSGYTVANLQDYAHLPTINKTIMMANFDTINTAGLRLADVMAFALAKETAHDYTGYYLDQYVVGLSSGTSGNKGLYLTPKALTRRLPGVFLARGGVGIRDLPLRILFILRVFSQGFADIRAPGIELRYLPSMTEIPEILNTYHQMTANILMAPPSVLRQMLPSTSQIRQPPRRIITYAEVLEPEEKARLSQAFRAPVVEIYQASEGQIASPCRAGQLHINEDLVYVELYDNDGQPVTRPGQTASHMLVTNLVNTVQPLLRYEMNDIIELGPPCSCGSHYRVISRIIGRHDDVLLLRTQTGQIRPVYPDLVSRWIITTDDHIREFLVRQTAPDQLQITIDIDIDIDQYPLQPARPGQTTHPAPLTQPHDQTSQTCTTSHAPGNETAIITRLHERLKQELATYDINCHLTINVQPIQLPADNRKLKRFTRETPQTDKNPE